VANTGARPQQATLLLDWRSVALTKHFNLNEICDRVRMSFQISDGGSTVNQTQDEEQWRPGERPEQAPTQPYDPNRPNPRATNPLPIPSDERQPVPITEPDNAPDPVGDPQRGQPERV